MIGSFESADGGQVKLSHGLGSTERSPLPQLPWFPISLREGGLSVGECLTKRYWS